MKTKLKVLILAVGVAVAGVVVTGCGTPPKSAGTADATGAEEHRELRLLAAFGANEAVIEDERNAAVLQEVTDGLDVFCGKGEADSLFIIQVVRRLPDRLHISDKTKRRLGHLALLVDELGGKINPSDYVAWGGVGCAVREGIKRGLALGGGGGVPATEGAEKK
jgi:hypothetical protein